MFEKNYYFSISIYKPINCVLICYFQLNLYISAYQRTETNCPLDCRYVAAFLIQKINKQSFLLISFPVMMTKNRDSSRQSNTNDKLVVKKKKPQREWESLSQPKQEMLKRNTIAIQKFRTQKKPH